MIFSFASYATQNVIMFICDISINFQFWSGSDQATAKLKASI